MLRLFQSSGPVTLVLYFIFSIGLHLHYLIQPQEFNTSYETMISNKIFIEWLNFDKLPNIILSFIHFLIVTVTGILFSVLLRNAKLLQKAGIIPGAVFVVCMSIFPQLHLVSPQIFCVALITVLLSKIFNTYNQTKVDHILFDTGVISALISLIYYPAIIFTLYSMLAIFRLRSTSLREFLILLSGIVVICFLVFTITFWFGTLPELTAQFYLPSSLPLVKDFLSTINVVRLVILGSVLLISLWYLTEKFSSNLVQVRKYFGAVINLFIFSVLLFFLSPKANLDQIQFVLLPVSVFISYYLFNSKNKVTTELIFIGLITTAILFQYINFA